MPQLPESVALEIEQRIKEKGELDKKYCFDFLKKEKERYIEFNNIDCSGIHLDFKNKILNNTEKYEEWCIKVEYITREIDKLASVMRKLEKYKYLNGMDRVINDFFNIISNGFISDEECMNKVLREVMMRKTGSSR